MWWVIKVGGGGSRTELGSMVELCVNEDMRELGLKRENTLNREVTNFLEMCRGKC